MHRAVGDRHSPWDFHLHILAGRGPARELTARVRRLDRLLALALFLGARRRVRASDLADRFSVSLRTVYRDMRALTDAGFPLEGNAGDGYRLHQESYLRPLAFDEEEAELLAVASRAMAASVDGRDREVLARAMAKLDAALRPPARRRVAQIEARIVVPTFVRASAPNAAMLAAIRERQSASIAYVDPRSGKRTRRTIEPVGLVCRGDAWWIVAFCRMRQGARAFRVDAITEWKSAGAFEPREGFSFDSIIERDRGMAEDLFGY